MPRAVLCLLLITTSFVSAAQTARETSPSFQDRVASLQKKDGFLPFYWDAKKGTLLFELSPAALDREFLYFTALGSGIGSIKVFADRSSIATNAVCHFRRVGTRVLTIQENPAFRAENGSSDLKKSVESSFPTSVLASLPIEAERDGTLLVNANPLLLRDATDLISQLRRPTQAINGVVVRSEASDSNWKLDDTRSVVDLDFSASFPLNTEIEALLTFTNDAEVDYNQPDAHVLSLREHHSFVALPESGYETREFDPRVGFEDLSFQDFSQPFNRPLRRRYIQRWRLEKKDPSSAISEPVKPITFYLERAVPEPMRSALKRGALWWNAAFEQAGFRNALRVEDLPEGASPLDIRYPSIQWTNRSGRGWSVGMTQADPRTGEIVHAIVQLDSHRMRTVSNYWNATVPPGHGNKEPALDSFAALDDLDPQISEEQVMLNRLALLTCHEVGHVLGLDHNFVASTFGRGSVMDYYAPRIKIRDDGSADLADAYMQGTGSYDHYAIEWGYSQGPQGATSKQERARLNEIVSQAIAKGIVWGNEADPRWNAYDDGADPVEWLKQVWPVRDALLARYGANTLHPGEPASRLASRFPLIYLFHRYALAAAINVIGSAKIPPAVAGDGQAPIAVWPSASQREALQLVLRALQAKELEISPDLWKALAPPEPGREDPERFVSSAGYLFSPQDGARAVADIVAGGLLDAQRMQRLAVIARETAGAPAAGEVVSALVRAAFTDATPASSLKSSEDIVSSVQVDVTEHLMLLAADTGATPEAQSTALAGVYDVQKIIRGRTDAAARRLNREIELFLSNPQQNTPKLKPSGAPPGPPI